MNHFHKGIAPLILVLLIALGLGGGAAGGYALREPIKKAITGTTTTDEIKTAVDQFKQEQSNFQLEGVATSVDATNSILTVNIKSSTASIQAMRLSETPIVVTATTAISAGTASGLKIADIPIDSQVHVGGTVTAGKLTATKVIVQKAEANENKGDRFSVGGTVKEVTDTGLTIDVKTANNKVKDKKGTTVAIKTDAATVIEKTNASILLSEIKVGDEVQVTGVIVKEEYIASKIEVKVKETAGELELETEQNANQNQGTTKNKEFETETNTNTNSVKSSTTNPNSNAGGNSTTTNTNNGNSNKTK